MSKYQNSINKDKKKNINKVIKKSENQAKNGPKLSENKQFLVNLYNNTKLEIKKVNSYLANLNHNLKIIKNLIKKEE